MRPYEYKEYTLDRWRDHFAHIYGHKNKFKTAEQIWSRMLEEIAELIPVARLPDYEAIGKALPDIFAWLLAFCDVQGISLEDAVWDRFGKGCPWCGADRNCMCIYGPERASVQRIQEPSREPLFAATRQLKDWIQGFDDLYGVPNKALPLTYIISHLVESAGAVAKAIRQRQSTEEVEKKVAHVFAWLIGVYIKCRFIVKDYPEFAELIIEKYTHCPKCHTIPCSCILPIDFIFIGMVPEDSYAEEEVIKDLMEGEHLSFEFIQNIPENPPEKHHVTILRHAKKSHAVVLALNHTITLPLISLFCLSQQVGKPAVVFARKVADRDQLLSQFLTDFISINELFEFRDNSQLKSDLKAWLRQFRRGHKPFYYKKAGHK